LSELTRALTTREPRYETIGVSVDGTYRQLNANILQLENEYYSSIRPKPAGKTPRLISALRKSGIEYVEVRTLDLNPFAPLGVTIEQARFIEVLLIYCVLAESGPISDAEQSEIDQRELTVAWEGRKPGLKLERDGKTVGLRGWALELLDRFASIASLLDGDSGLYSSAVSDAREAALDPGLTLSARVLREINAGRQSFFEWAFEIAERHKERFLEFRFPEGRFEALDTLARQSLDEAKAIESAEEPPFDEFLGRFLASGTA
jgi:glutamate--cysteine ligase